MKDSYETLEVVCEDKVTTVTLNRPEVMNAFNTSMMKELDAVWTELGQSENRVVLLTGAGERAFCAGADLKERKGLSEEVWKQQHAIFKSAMRSLRALRMPVIAVVNGVALGGGLELALACDFILASSKARLGLPETRVGIMPGLGGSQFLARAVGTRRAKQMIFSAKMITGEEAHEIGLVNEVFESELLEKAKVLARTIAGNAPLAVRNVKRAINDGYGCDVETSLAVERAAYDPLLETEDRLEGILAFNEKRRPNFLGR